MRNKGLPIDIINSLSNKIPTKVLIDINKRMMDWMISGGNEDDEYMWRQVRFAENWIKYHGEEL